MRTGFGTGTGPEFVLAQLLGAPFFPRLQCNSRRRKKRDWDTNPVFVFHHQFSGRSRHPGGGLFALSRTRGGKRQPVALTLAKLWGKKILPARFPGPTRSGRHFLETGEARRWGAFPLPDRDPAPFSENRAAKINSVIVSVNRLTETGSHAIFSLDFFEE